MSKIQRTVGSGSSLFVLLVSWVVVMSGVACFRVNERNISEQSPYSAVIGRQYRVIGEIYAYGVKKSLSDDGAFFVALIPDGRAAGPEYTFRTRVPIGSTLRVVNAWRHFESVLPESRPA